MEDVVGKIMLAATGRNRNDAEDRAGDRDDVRDERRFPRPPVASDEREGGDGEHERAHRLDHCRGHHVFEVHAAADRDLDAGVEHRADDETERLE